MDNMTEDSIGNTLQDFIHDFGIPVHLTFDGHQSQLGGGYLFMKTIRKHNIKYNMSSPRRPEQNPAEGGIRELKRRWYRIMQKRNVPKRLWDYGLVWVSETGNLTVSGSRYAQALTGLEIITGEIPDISEYVDFSFYDWVTYRANTGLGELSLGRWLGVSHKIGQLMSYWILTIKGRVISCTAVQKLTALEQKTIEWKDRMEIYEKEIHDKVTKTRETELNVSDMPQWNRLALNEYDNEFTTEFQNTVSDEFIPEADDYYLNDGYVNMEVGMRRGADGEIERATVKKRAIDPDGTPIGIPNKNPLLDTRKFEVEYRDGPIEIMPANIIAENIMSQVDEQGHKQMMIDEIVDHKKSNDAIIMEDVSERTRMKIHTTKG